jgi:hypothetical protein
MGKGSFSSGSRVQEDEEPSLPIGMNKVMII